MTRDKREAFMLCLVFDGNSRILRITDLSWGAGMKKLAFMFLKPFFSGNVLQINDGEEED